MKKTIIKDERLITEQRKTISEAFTLVMIFLLASTLVQQLVFKATFQQYAVEFIAFFGGCAYMLVRNILLGNTIFQERSEKKYPFLLNVLVIGVTVTLTNTFLGHEDFTSTTDLLTTMLIGFVISTFSASLCLFIIYQLSKKRAATLEKKFDQDDL